MAGKEQFLNELAALRRRFRIIFEEALDVIMIVDGNDGCILDVNPSIERVLGYDRPFLIGKRFSFLFPPLPETPPRKILEIVQIYGDVFSSQEFLRVDGSTCPMDLTACVIPWSENHEAIHITLRDVTERLQAEKLLQKTLREKEILLRELHHRVKNNLQLISSIIDFQTDLVESDKAIEILQQNQRRIQAMVEIHNQLYQDAAQLDMASYMRGLAENIQQSYDRTDIQLEINVANIVFDIDVVITCGLIINELVSNSFKHAFLSNQPGKIYISLQPRNSHQYELIIGDNGKGIPSDVNFDEPKSLGLKLVQMLARQLEASLEIKCDDGVDYIFVFPEPKAR